MLHCGNFFRQQKCDTALWDSLRKLLNYNNYKNSLV